MLRYLLATAALMAATFASAVDFDVHDFTLSDFRNADRVTDSCSAGQDVFWCDLQDATLTRIPTKGVDLFFGPAGEVVGAFAKHQKGQVLQNYNIDQRENLIPPQAVIAGATLLIDGERHAPEAIDATWRTLNETEIEGVFAYRAGPYEVRRTVRVSNINHTLLWDVTVTRVDAADEANDEVVVQLAFPGIGNTEDPVVKIGRGVGESGTFSASPLPQAVADPSYASLQNADNQRAFAMILRPEAPGHAAIPIEDDRLALQRTLGGREGDEVRLQIGSYLGPNELVRYYQEGYHELPGLFRPNILGRISLGVLWVLETIHEYVPSWGLSIIVLTLMFRALIWPLISTQTKSMFGMQELQPKIQALQKKYKDDRETLTQETMKLYRESGVNPAGGCLPILLQMPLFIILWRVFVNFEFDEGFLWVPDLGQADPFFILPVLYVAVMFGMSYFAARGNPQMLRQQILINVVFAFILFTFPAGVILYFVFSMGIQVLQYWLISRANDKKKALAGAKG
ncbi:MAG: membrane protein insertase YidC [Trueperaceae bacterium]